MVLEQGAGMEEGPYLWREELRVRSFEVGPRGTICLPHLCLFLQEAAWNHAQRLGFGYSDMAARDLLWVIFRMLVHIDRYPRWQEKIEILTWPSGMERLVAHRDFEVRDEAGHIIAAASSDWLILDRERRQPQAVAPIVGLRPEVLPLRRALGQRPRRIPSLPGPCQRSEFTVLLRDLDLQGHVNHTSYMEWILDACPVEIHNQYLPVALEINFLAESGPGQKLQVWTSRPVPSAGSIELFHQVIRAQEGQEVCRARTLWRMASPDSYSQYPGSLGHCPA